MDVVDFEIFGDDMQYVEIELDPGEAAIGEAGAMMMMQDGVEMDTVFGDGSAQQGGLFGKLMGAGKRLVTGESLFTTIFHNESKAKRRVAFRQRRRLSEAGHPTDCMARNTTIAGRLEECTDRCIRGAGRIMSEQRHAPAASGYSTSSNVTACRPSSRIWDCAACGFSRPATRAAV